MMPPEPLAALKSLQRTRAEEPQFASKIEFAKWADKVSGLLAFDETLRYRFEHKVKLAKFKYNTQGSFADTINEAIGILNQAVTKLEYDLASVAEVVPVPNSAADPAAKYSGKKENWYSKPIGLIGIGVVIVILGALAVYLLKTHLALPL